MKAQFQSRSVASDPDAAKSLYVADLKFAKPGRYEVLGVVRLDGRLVAAGNAGPPLTVVARRPGARRRATGARRWTPRPRPTSAATSSRSTPASRRRRMHDVDFADVVGKKPAVLLFATPALCQSRVCGPVVDIAEQVKAERGDEADVHPPGDLQRQRASTRASGRRCCDGGCPPSRGCSRSTANGRVAARLEGAYSAEELERAVDAAVKGAT